MTRRLALLAPLLALTACPRLDPMQRQAKYKAYQPNPFYADGLAMRQPPAGTVPYGTLAEPAVLRGVGPDGKPVPLLPVPVTAELISRGRNRFDVTCAVCHGLLGDGESQVALNMSLRRPPSLHEFRQVTDGLIFQVITDGFGLMPAYGPYLSVEDRWAIVAYVRALQLSQHAVVDELPPEVQQRLQKNGKNR